MIFWGIYSENHWDFTEDLMWIFEDQTLGFIPAGN